MFLGFGGLWLLLRYFFPRLWNTDAEPDGGEGARIVALAHELMHFIEQVGRVDTGVAYRYRKGGV